MIADSLVLTLLKGLSAKQQDWVVCTLQLVRAWLGSVRPGPKHPGLAEALGIDAQLGGGQHHTFLHVWQQGGESLLLPAREQGRWGLGQGDALDAHQTQGARGAVRRREVGDPHIIPEDLALQNLVAQVVKGDDERRLAWRGEGMLMGCGN